MNYKVSIIIVTKSRLKYIKNNLTTLLAQTYPIYEIIIVDGGTRGLGEYLSGIDNIKYILQKGNGRCNARNEGIRNSKGDIIVFIDDDVKCEKNWLKELVETYDDGIIGVCGMVVENKDNNRSKLKKVFREKILKIPPGLTGKITPYGRVVGNFYTDKKVEVEHMKGCNMSFRKNVFEKVGYFDERYDAGDAFREETDLSYRCSKAGKLVYNPRSRLVHYNCPTKSDSFYSAVLHRYFILKNKVLKNTYNRFRFEVYHLLLSLFDNNHGFRYLKGNIFGLIYFRKLISKNNRKVTY
jgi:GT2 family glycosyltransferase